MDLTEDTKREALKAKSGGEHVNGQTRNEDPVGLPGIAELPPHSPHSLRELLAYLKEFLRPAYHTKKIKEDVKASIHALRNRDLEILKDDASSLAHALRGRLLATYFLVGPFGILGPISSTYFQYGFGQHLPFVAVTSFLISVIVGNIFSIIGFQTIWAISARPIYPHKGPPFFDFLSFWRDILPLQRKGFQRWAAANMILLPLCTILMTLIDRFLPVLSHVIPVAVLAGCLEIIFVHTSLIRLMGDLFEKESWRIAGNHAHAEVEEG